LVGLGLPGIATATRLALSGVLAQELPFVTYFPALIAAAIWGGMTGGLVCLLVSSAAAALFLLPTDAPLGWMIGSFLISGGALAIVGAAMADTVRELKVSRAALAGAQKELHTLVGELAHRNRNALSVVMAIVSQSTRAAETKAEAALLINNRLDAMARAQDVLVNSEGRTAPLLDLLERALEPFDLRRFTFAPSPRVELPPPVATSLALLVHELATNATKYGALSVPGGRVRLSWSSRSEGLVHIVWRETGGPPVTPPAAKGFGSRLLGQGLAAEIGRPAVLVYEAAGLICTVTAPLADS
jgi:two-component sensor histidine kinase